MEILEIGFQPLHDLDGILNRGLVDIDLLEAAHQRPVLLEELTVFLVGCRSDAADGSRRQRRLEQVGRIHRATRGGTCTNHGVNFIDEHDRAGHLLDFLDHLLEAFLEIAAITRSGEQRPHVERKDRAVLQHFGNIALDDALGQAFSDGRLADTGVAHIERVVLGAAAQDLNGAVDLGLPADQRINLAGSGLLVEVHAIGFECVACRLGIFVAHRSLILIHAAHRARFRRAGPLCDPMGNIVYRVVACHLLLLQEVCGMAFALGKDRNQYIGAGHFFAS